MAVTLRLSRRGSTRKPFYRIVASEKQKPRDGRFLEIIGSFNPTKNPAIVSLKEDRVKYWLSVGAEATEVVRSLVRRSFGDIIESRVKHQRSKIQARRRARKARAKSGKGKSSTGTQAPTA